LTRNTEPKVNGYRNLNVPFLIFKCIYLPSAWGKEWPTDGGLVTEADRTVRSR